MRANGGVVSAGTVARFENQGRAVGVADITGRENKDAQPLRETPRTKIDTCRTSVFLPALPGMGVTHSRLGWEFDMSESETQPQPDAVWKDCIQVWFIEDFS